MSIAQAEEHQRKHGFMKGGDASCALTSRFQSTQGASNGAQTFDPKRAPEPRMNKTEAEYGLILEAMKQRGEVIEYAFEPFCLMYGDDAFYKPDWVARTGGYLTIEAVARLCRMRVIDIAADRTLWFHYTALVRQVHFRIIEVKGGRIFPEAFPRFKAAKLRHQWASFELHQKTKDGWRKLL